MKILVNDVPIDYQLETESSAGQVFSELNDWLRSNGHRIHQVKINGATVDLDNAAWKDTPVGTVEELSVYAVSLREEEIRQIETLIQYFDLLQRVLSQGTQDQLRDVLDEHPYIESSLPALLPEARGLVGEALGVQSVTGQTAASVTQDQRERLARQLDAVRTVLDDRWKELLDPQGQLLVTMNALEQILPQLEELPGYLHTGKEKEALESVGRFSEIASKLLRLLPIWIETLPEPQTVEIDGQYLREFMNGTNQILTELETGLREQDLVLVSDLIEYETVPRFQALIEKLADLNTLKP